MPTANEVSGPQWVARFPGSSRLDDLAEPFKSAAVRFVTAVRNAGCSVTISATFRPPERAWLMRFSTAIARGEMQPEDIKPNPAIAIEWVHRTDSGAADPAKSRSAAIQMRDAYRVSPTSPLPALASRHTERNAVDMSISWVGTLKIVQKDGSTREISSSPRTGLNAELIQVGVDYGVIKAQFKDDPHWSNDGH